MMVDIYQKKNKKECNSNSNSRFNSFLDLNSSNKNRIKKKQ